MVYGAILISLLGTVAYEVAMDEPPPLRGLWNELRQRLGGPALIACAVMVAISLIVFAYIFWRGIIG